MLKQINTTHRPVYITQNGEARGVLVDTDTYENMQKALGILKLVSQGEKEIENRKFTKQSEVFKEIEARYFSDVKK